LGAALGWPLATLGGVEGSAGGAGVRMGPVSRAGGSEGGAGAAEEEVEAGLRLPGVELPVGSEDTECAGVEGGREGASEGGGVGCWLPLSKILMRFLV